MDSVLIRFDSVQSVQSSPKSDPFRFRGYDETEKKTYCLVVTSSDEQESRQITALDELFKALFFMCEYIEGIQSKQQGKKRKSNPDDVEADEDQTGEEDRPGKMPNLKPEYEAVFTMCVKVFLTFAFTGEAVVNCKLFKAWSLLRTELQGLVLKVQQQLEIDLSSCGAAIAAAAASSSGAGASAGSSGGSDPKAGKGKRKDMAKMNALELAEILCSTFVDKAPTTIATGEDDEEAALQRVAMVMKGGKDSSSPVSDVAQRLHDYISETMIMPLALHEPPRKALRVLAEAAVEGSCEKDLVDVIAIAKAAIEETVPFSWVMFASDVSEMYGDRGHWPEGSGKAFGIGQVRAREKILSSDVRRNIYKYICTHKQNTSFNLFSSVQVKH